MRQHLASCFLVASLSVGCADAPKTPEAPTTTLADCAEERPSQDVTSWSCGPLTAVETLVLDASSEDVEEAFDGFAANFGGKSAKRIDSVYHTGERRHAAMRLEGIGESGEAQEAQMVAISVGSGVRLISCATKDLGAPCGPVMSALVLELSQARSDGEVRAARNAGGAENGL